MQPPTLLQRLGRSLGLWRADSAPQLPAPVAQRADSGSSVWNPFTGLGGWGDKGSVGRPSPWVLDLSLLELRALYRHNGLANRLVRLLPSRACRRGWTVPDFDAEDRRLALPVKVEQGMRWAQLYGGALVVPVTIDDIPPGFRSNPTAWLRQPLDPARVQSVAAVQVFDAVEISAAHWDRNPASPTFRLPDLWRVSTTGFNLELHASRVVHFRGAERPPSEMGTGRNGLPDDSFLQALWDDVRHLAEIGNAGAVAAHEIREAVLSLAALSELSTGDEAGKVDTQLELIARGRGQLGYTLIGTDDKFESRSNPPTGFKDLSDAAWEALSAATGIPATILRGDAPGGLSTDDDAGHEGFRQLVSGYQESNRYDLEKLYAIVGAAQDGPTGGAGLEDRALVFAALDEPDEASMAATRKIVAETDEINVRLGAYSSVDVARSRYGENGYSFELQPVDIPEPTPSSPYASVGLPALVDALIVGQSGARRLLGVDDSFAPTPDELALVVAAQGHAPAQPVPRADAAPDADSVCVLIPCADPGLLARVEAAIGQALVPETESHLTVLYVGTGLGAEALAEVVDAVGDAVEAMDPSLLIEFPTLRAFAPGPDGTPIVLEYGDAWTVANLNAVLLRALAHRITARQWPFYRPHLTIGYAPAPLTPEAQAALLGIDVTVDDGGDTAALSLRVPVAEVRVQVGGRLVATAYPGIGLVAAAPYANEPNMPAELEPVPAA